MVFNQGPIVMLRLELGLHSKGRLSTFEVLCEYLQNNQLHQVSRTVNTYDLLNQGTRLYCSELEK